MCTSPGSVFIAHRGYQYSNGWVNRHSDYKIVANAQT